MTGTDADAASEGDLLLGGSASGSARGSLGRNGGRSAGKSSRGSARDTIIGMGGRGESDGEFDEGWTTGLEAEEEEISLLGGAGKVRSPTHPADFP